jgi:hypothetical protein
MLLLIYIVSLTLQSAMNMTINNQYSNIELTCPVYFVKGAVCHIQFPQQVNPKSIMKGSFVTGIDRDTFGGVLLYRLQWKQDALISVQLLVIWGYKSNGLYSHARIIKHEKNFIWNEYKLKRLYDVYDSRCNIDLDAEEWLLDDNTKLRTKCEIPHGSFEINIIISEEKNLPYPLKPLWIDSNR